MSKISNISKQIIGLSFFLGCTAVLADPGMGIDTFSIGQIGTFMDTVQAADEAPALKHENPAVLRIESDYRHSHKNEMAQSLKQDEILNIIQMNNHAVFVQLKF